MLKLRALSMWYGFYCQKYRLVPQRKKLLISFKASLPNIKIIHLLTAGTIRSTAIVFTYRKHCFQTAYSDLHHVLAPPNGLHRQITSFSTTISSNSRIDTETRSVMWRKYSSYSDVRSEPNFISSVYKSIHHSSNEK